MSHPDLEVLWQQLVTFHQERNLSHLGSVASCFEVLYTLVFHILKPGDELILSKGHAISALYVMLKAKGELSSFDFDAACRPKQIHGLSAHTPYAPQDFKHPWLRWGSGALGCGMSIASGLALAEKLKPQGRRVYCLISEGDLNTGLAYQALSFASRMRLNALTFIFDNNGFQATSAAEEVLDLPALESWLKNLEFQWRLVDGHDTQLLCEVLSQKTTDRTQWIWCKTSKTKRLNQTNPLSAHYASSISPP